MTELATVPPASAGELRDSVFALLDEYEATEGVSPADDYDDSPRVHPMAEGKYLLGLAELVEAGLLTPSLLQRRARPVLDRLESLDRGDGTTSCWGLGFSFRDLSVDEPFTITTAIVLNGLTRVAPHLSGNAHKQVQLLRDRTVAWLLDQLPRVEVDNRPFPAYSLNLAVAPFNIAAYWAGVLIEALAPDDARRAEVRAVADTVMASHVPDVGWPYEVANPRVDLVHNCYIGWGLLTALPERATELEVALLAMLGQFAGVPWFDAFDVRDRAQVLAEGAPPRGHVRFSGDRALVGFDRQARAWSVGEALVLLGALGASPRVGAYASDQMRRVANLVVDSYLPEQRYRHSMHLAHGLAVALRRARELAGNA